MKELLLIHHHGGIGGAGVSLLDIVDSLKDDYVLTVVCPKEPSTMVQELKKRKVKVIELNYVGILGFYNGGAHKLFEWLSIKNYIKIFLTYFPLKKIISQFNGDIVAVNSMTLSWVGKLIKSSGKKGICFHRETFISGNNFGTSILKNQLKNYFEKIIFISEYDYNEFDTLEDSKKAIIKDKVHKEKFIKNQINEITRFKLLYLGGFVPLKGAHLIIEAMLNLKKFDIELNFVGTPYNDNYSQNLIKLIEENELQEKINFIELTTQPDKLYHQSSALVFPSTQPHQSRPVYEAGFSKIPVIISDFENTREFINDDFNGFTFTPNNVESLSETILKVFKLDKEKLNEIVDNNFQLVQMNNSYETLKDELLTELDIEME